ncbi:thioredoxin family protein [Haliscomenobacter sp.]|uniref:thioredoxin family protein n=1 Tax=Haliscomenobacter sp. TaxID=2717303 RepID=UPI003BACB823
MKTKTGFGIGFFASVFFLLTIFSFGQTNPGLKVGDIAPDFQLKSTSGKLVSLKDYKNVKGYIVVFTCNTCPYAQAYEQRIIDLHNKMAPMGWPVVAIMPNNPSVQPGDGFDKMVERAKEKKYPFEYVLDEGQKVFPVYGAVRTPHVFLLDKDRKVRYIGGVDDNSEDETLITRRYVEEAIAAVEKGGEPEPNLTKAVGCMIKVKK